MSPVFRESDLVETFTRSGGNGGQNVNKVSTCVILVHLPTGITVRCDTERTQGRNREIARARLSERLIEREQSLKDVARDAAERTRRQKRRPSRNARRRNVESKRRRGAIKAGRLGKNNDHE